MLAGFGQETVPGRDVRGFCRKVAFSKVWLSVSRCMSDMRFLDFAPKIALCDRSKSRTEMLRESYQREGGKEMRGQRWVWLLCVVLLGGAVGRLHAEDIGCVSTTFRVLGANDKMCVSAFDDPKVPGVTCHLSHARTGGMKGTVGVAEDRSRFALACRQVGPITVDLDKLPKKAEVFSVKTSLIFKETQVVRLVDLTHRTLVYLAYSTRVVEGSPFNSLSTVPVMRWEP